MVRKDDRTHALAARRRADSVRIPEVMAKRVHQAGIRYDKARRFDHIRRRLATLRPRPTARYPCRAMTPQHAFADSRYGLEQVRDQE